VGWSRREGPVKKAIRKNISSVQNKKSTDNTKLDGGGKESKGAWGKWTENDGEPAEVLFRGAERRKDPICSGTYKGYELRAADMSIQALHYGATQWSNDGQEGEQIPQHRRESRQS